MASGTDRDSVRAREKEAFGGIKVGSAFFGWLTTIGATILLVAIVSAIAAGDRHRHQCLQPGPARRRDRGRHRAAGDPVSSPTSSAGTSPAGWPGSTVPRQGLAVWLWAVLIAIILTVIGVIAGQQTDITSQLNLPAIPVSSSDLTDRRTDRPGDRSGGHADRGHPRRPGRVCASTAGWTGPASTRPTTTEAASRQRRPSTNDDEEVAVMNIPKDKIIDMIRSRGDHDQAEQAQAELPDQVDTDQHSDLLSKFNIDPKNLGWSASATRSVSSRLAACPALSVTRRTGHRRCWG
ncbi:MAG: hypothetical protein WKF47_12105 [Geodermatophilaceae bacterium]